MQLSRFHVALSIAGLVLIAGTACAAVQVASVAPTMEVPPTRTLVPTFTATPDWTATSTPTNTFTPTSTPTTTPTPSPTDTATPEPPTRTPQPTAPPQPEEPTDTPPPEPEPATPTPSIDFRVVKQEVMPVIVDGSCNWRHNVFVTVVDAAGNPLDGVVVADKWGNYEIPSGDKGPGRCDFDLWANSLELYVKGDVNGTPYRSEMTRRLSSDQPEISDMIKGGVCKDTAECEQKIASNSFCYGHYAYEVTFQRTW